MNWLVFDIETVPDVELGRRLLGLTDVDDRAVAEAMFARSRAERASEFLPHLQHRVIAIACALRTRDTLRVWSLGDPEAHEDELLRRFFEGLDRYSPDLVSWNGGGFDLPVLHYRALRAGIAAPRYWEVGEEDTAFRYNNYLSRYHWRHIDLMDVLSGFQPRARASLADMAALLGFPGKLGFSGDKVWEAYRAGELTAIRRYCETDVLNTYLVFLRFEHLRGRMDQNTLAAEIERVRTLLRASGEPHHAEFLRAWEALAPAAALPEAG
jgi:predicted PolB exonuclease-like 3'-5' exonuclease